MLPKSPKFDNTMLVKSGQTGISFNYNNINRFGGGRRYGMGEQDILEGIKMKTMSFKRIYNMYQNYKYKVVHYGASL